MAGEIKVILDEERCVGSTMCIQLAPAVFELNDQAQGSVIDPNADARERVVDAAENCPMEAIRVEDVDTGTVLFP